MLRQFTIYDDGIETDKRPCRYRFYRYIGQEVYHTNDPNDICVVEEIESPYYTRIRSKGKGVLLIGTPTTIYPIDKSEQKGDFSSEQI